MDKKVVKNKRLKPLKDGKIRKIVEYFEPLPQEDLSSCKISNNDVKAGDTIVDADKDTDLGEEKKKNAFSILMQGGSHSTTPVWKSLKRLATSSTKKLSR